MIVRNSSTVMSLRSRFGRFFTLTPMHGFCPSYSFQDRAAVNTADSTPFNPTTDHEARPLCSFSVQNVSTSSWPISDSAMCPK